MLVDAEHFIGLFKKLNEYDEMQEEELLKQQNWNQLEEEDA